MSKRGTVKFFDATKGFGFIKEEGSNEEFFVHATGLNQPIADGDEVEFEVKDGKRGLTAVNVSKM